MEHTHTILITLIIVVKLILIYNLRKNSIFIDKLINENIKVKEMIIKKYENSSLKIDIIVIFISILVGIFLYTSAILICLSFSLLLTTEYQYILINKNKEKERLLIL